MNSSIPSFSRNLNLLIVGDCSTFYQELVRLSYTLPVTSEDELINLIQFGKEFFPESTFEISAGMTPIDEKLVAMIRHGQTEKFLENILPIICFLYNFRGDKEFISKVKTNITNPTQFNDTFFELKCLNNFHKNGYSFQYEPEVFVGEGEKKPDFRLTKNDIELFCECKQVRTGQNRAELKFDEQRAYVEGKLPKTLQRQLSDAKLRLEINFQRSPSLADLDELAQKVNLWYSETQDLRELAMQQVGNSIEYLVISQSKPSPFPMMERARTISFQVRIGKPFLIGDPINSSGGEISFVSTNLTRRTAESFKNIIREAKKQLPNDKLGIIIINRAKLSIAKEAIERRINLKHYSNIIVFVINPFDDFGVCYKTQYRVLLSELFKGFQPQNPFVKM